MPEPRQRRLRLYKASSFFERVAGLHAFRRLPADTGLWLIPCKAIHTFGLAYSIDAVFLNRERRFIKIVQNMPPGRIAVCLAAHSVIELPAGYCRANPAHQRAIAEAVRAHA